MERGVDQSLTDGSVPNQSVDPALFSSGTEQAAEGSPILILVMSEDIIFRRGLRATLMDHAQFSIVAEVDDPRSLLAVLVQFFEVQGEDHPFLDHVLILLWHLSPTLGFDPLLYQHLQQVYPQVRVLGLGRGEVVPVTPWPGLSLLWGSQLQPDRLVSTLEQLAQGKGLWWVQASPDVPQPPLPTRNPPASPRDWIRHWTLAACRSGLAQIDEDLQSLDETGHQHSLTWINAQLLQGQQRELRLVRWFLQKGQDWFSTQEELGARESGSRESGSRESTNLGSRAEFGRLPTQMLPESVLPQVFDLVPSEASPKSFSPDRFEPGVSLDYSFDPPLETLIFDRITAKLTTPLVNLTPFPLEIESLNLSRRCELVLLVLQALGDRLVELRHSQVTPEQVQNQQLEILQDLWKDALTRFFGQYTTLPPSDGRSPKLKNQSEPISLVPPLLQGLALVRSSLLQTIPHRDTIFQTLLFQQPVTIDGVPYRCQSPEAIDRLCQLVENLIIQVSNGVVQPLLNQFSQVELIKQTFFHPRLLSTRQIERFRNDLSWKYRFTQSFEEPKNIYESVYYLWIIEVQGINRLPIYAPRQEELSALTPWQQTITLGLEFRDAIAPRLQSLTSWIGQGLVYLLTQVVGRALGLIGRGILQGLGTAWSDRSKKN